QEGDSIAMLRIHVCLNLEHEAGQRIFLWLDVTRFSTARARRGSMFDEGVQQLTHAEIGDRRAEEYRRELAAKVGFDLELVGRAAHQLDFVAIILRVTTEKGFRLGAVQSVDYARFAKPPFLGLGV